MMSTLDYNKTDIQIWVDALRSGDYTQARRALQNNVGHCCLGVACELFIPKENHIRCLEGQLHGHIPHHQISSPLWISNLMTDFREKHGASLTKLNDRGVTFNQIADLLEKYYIKDQA